MDIGKDSLCVVLKVHLIILSISGCGSAWLERLVWDQEVAGSNPVTPTAVTTTLPFQRNAGVVQW